MIGGDAEENPADEPAGLAQAEAHARRKNFPLADFGSSRHEQRLGIADAERFQHIQLSQQRQADRGKFQRRVHFQQRQQMFLGERLAHGSLESFSEIIELRRLDRQTTSIFMAAEFLQMLSATAESVDQVKAADAPRRAFTVAAVKTNDHRGTVIFFDDARSDDTEYTGVPAFSGEHERMAA